MQRTLFHLATGLAVCLGGLATSISEAEACEYSQCQSAGAVDKPTNFDMSLPFENGETVHVGAAYGPNAGSSLHCRASDSQCANDWYALDFSLPDHPNNGKGQPVLASAAGTVIDAGWGSAGWSNYGKRVYIEYDFDADGHKYVSIYAHLDTIAVNSGDHVDKGQKIGTLGGSCEMQLSCSSFSAPHLHWALHRDSNFGGSGSGGSYGGRAVKPEPIDGHTGIQQGQNLTSKNGEMTTVEDCGVVIPAGGGWVEEDSDCAEVVGMLSDAGGHDGHAYVGTHQSQDPDYAHGVIYRLNFEQAGEYLVFANVPSGVSNLTGEALYKVSTPTGTDEVPVDQSANAGTIVDLGVFAFEKGLPEDQWIRLGDNYRDAANQGKNFALDGLRIVPKGRCECLTPDRTETDSCPGGTRSRTCDGCQWSAWSDCSGDGDTGPQSDSGSSTSDTYVADDGGRSDGADGADGRSRPPRVESQSCACSGSMPPDSAPVSWTLLLAFLLGLRARRKKR